MKRTLVITSDGFQPYVNSVAILMRNLFYFFPKQSYVVLLNRPKKDNIRLDRNQIIRHDYVCINNSILERFNFINKIITMYLLIIKTIRIIVKYKISNILVVPMSRDNYEVIAYLSSRLFRKRLYVYLFDIYNIPGIRRKGIINNIVAKYFEAVLMKSADKVFVMSESLGDYYEDIYGIKCVYLPHTVIIENNNKKGLALPRKDEKKAVYAGMIYEAHYDSILNVANAINSLEDYNVKFYLYTPRSREKLEEVGIKGKNIEIKDFVMPEEIPTILSEADVLILPMAFNSPYPDIIKTASPGKLPVYLASGTPILVHAPKESYVANYFKKHNCGVVVDRQDLTELKENIKRIIDNDDLRKYLKENAKKVLRDHDAEKVSKILQEYLKGEL